MFGNGFEISLIYCQILGPLVLDWAPNHFLLGAQLAPGEKRSVCIPVYLGVIITDCMDWGQVNTFQEFLPKPLGFLHKNSAFAPKSTDEVTYKTLVRCSTNLEPLF